MSGHAISVENSFQKLQTLFSAFPQGGWLKCIDFDGNSIKFVASYMRSIEFSSSEYNLTAMKRFLETLIMVGFSRLRLAFHFFQAFSIQ